MRKFTDLTLVHDNVGCRLAHDMDNVEGTLGLSSLDRKHYHDNAEQQIDDDNVSHGFTTDMNNIEVALGLSRLNRNNYHDNAEQKIDDDHVMIVIYSGQHI